MKIRFRSALVFVYLFARSMIHSVAPFPADTVPAWTEII